MKNIAVLALIGLLTKTETINAINLNRLDKTNVCISEIHEDTESLLGLDSTISMTEEPAAEAKPDPKKAEAEAKVAKEETDKAKKEAEASEKAEEDKNAEAEKKAKEANEVNPKNGSVADEKLGKTEINVSDYLRKQNAVYDAEMKKREEDRKAKEAEEEKKRKEEE